ncbi:MAG: gfo/Idh/MocA family oxidoreductase [Calditrichaeota bacterium]|nr:Gfo/Idh/MocA family oxidoreductase [Calditrichota bacterium]RQW06157.1 MAG: gfo/Idh/MocA family oxidoreductase [Calditrichota bacterium]
MNRKRNAGLPIHVGIVGCGGIAQVIHMPILKKHPDVKLTALCDTDASKAAILADKYDVQQIYEDIDDMLQREKLDVVFILTPNNLHLPMTLLALEAGKHVFVEKPAARNMEEVARISAQAEKSDKLVMVGMQNRFRTDVQALRKFILAEELGSLFFIKGRWLQAYHQSIKQPWLINKAISGGGVVMDLGIQLIDLIWWLAGKPVPVSTKSFGYEISEYLTVEDFCVACITFENNLSVSLELSWNFPIDKDHMYLELAGRDGTATLHPMRIQKIMHGQIVHISPNIRESKIVNFKMGYQREVNHFLDFLTGRTDHLESTIDDALQVFRIVDGIYSSFASKREVVLE